LTHITEQFVGSGLRERVGRDMGSIFPGEVFGEDLLNIPLGAAAAPSGLAYRAREPKAVACAYRAHDVRGPVKYR